MHGLLSPQHSSSSKADLFTKQRSPSSRNKRAPSVQEHSLCSSNQNLKVSKQDSPSDFSQEIRRRRSQYSQNNQLSGSAPNKKRQKVTNGAESNTQNIINSIQDLKEEYRTLKEAYKELIQQRMRSNEEMTLLKSQNSKVKGQIERHLTIEEGLMSEMSGLRSQLILAKKQLEGERLRSKKLQNDLYFLTEREKSKTEILHKDRHFQFENMCHHPQCEGALLQNKQVIEEISCKNITNDSQLLSFSLTSVIDESIRLDHLHRRRKEHVKVVSDLSSHGGGANNQFTNVEIKPKKEVLSHFKKNKKEIRIDTINESKAASVGNPLTNLLNLKSPVSMQKKSLKNLGVGNSSTSKRRRCEEKENVDVRNPKKKSKKMLQITSNQ